MDNVKNNGYYSGKIFADLEFVIEHTNGKTKKEIEEDDLLWILLCSA